MAERPVKPMLEYLPWTHNDIPDYINILGIDDQLFQQVMDDFDIFLANRYIQTANEEMIRQWEDLLSIEPDPANETLEFRRQRILNRLSLTVPYTTPYLRNRLDDLVGADKYYLDIDYDNYTINLSLRISQEQIYNEILIIITLIKPANMVFNTTWTYNSYEEVAQWTHEALSAYTHFEISTLDEIRDGP